MVSLKHASCSEPHALLRARPAPHPCAHRPQHAGLRRGVHGPAAGHGAEGEEAAAAQRGVPRGAAVLHRDAVLGGQGDLPGGSGGWLTPCRGPDPAEFPEKWVFLHKL